MKPYTMTKFDEREWLLEVEDEALGDHIKEQIDKGKFAVTRFGVGINTPLRVFKVKDDDVIMIEKNIENYLRKQ